MPRATKFAAETNEIQGLGSIIGTVQILLPYFGDLLYQVLIDEWLKIPLDSVRKLYDYIPRRIEAVLKAEGGPTPY